MGRISSDTQRLIDVALSMGDRESDVVSVDGQDIDFFQLTSRIGADLETALTVYERYGSPDHSDLERHFAADVVAGPNDGKPKLVAEAQARTDALLAMLRDGETDEVVDSIASGLGRLDDDRIPAVLWSLRDHPSWRVRWSLTFGAARHYPADLCLDILLYLTCDKDERVRDWAAHHLGNEVDADTPAVRDALAAIVDDDDLCARHEAIHALAVRRDRRALEPLMREMDTIVHLLESTPGDDRWKVDVDEVPDLGVAEESAWHLAAETGDDRFVPLLRISWADAQAEGEVPLLLSEAVESVFGTTTPPTT